MSEIIKTNIRLPSNLKNEIDRISQEEQISVNSTIVKLIEKALEAQNSKNIVIQNNNAEKIETLEDKIDFLLQQQEKIKEEIKQEMQKEILEDFKIFANILAKKIQEILAKDTTSYLTIKRPLVFEAVKNFAEQNKKPFLQKCDLIAAIDFSQQTTELKIYKILEAESYNNIKAVNIKNEQEKITIDLTNKVHYLSLLQIYRKI